MIAGLEEPTAGRIRIGDSDITETKAYQRNVNTVFQSYALFPHMSVLDNVMFGLRRRGDKDAKAKANEVLELVQLGQVSDKKPTQRIGIVADIEARPTIQGIRSGRDEVLEAALRHILGPGASATEIERLAKR